MRHRAALMRRDTDFLRHANMNNIRGFFYILNVVQHERQPTRAAEANLHTTLSLTVFIFID